MCRESRKHIIYYLSKVSPSTEDSLVGRRFNVGVAYNNVRIIAKLPDVTVDVRSVEHHEISSIPLVTSDGVTFTTSDEVIITMHQHAHHKKNKTIQSSPQI